MTKLILQLLTSLVWDKMERKGKKRKKKPQPKKNWEKSQETLSIRLTLRPQNSQEIPVIIPHCSFLKSNTFFVFLITHISHARSPQIPPSTGESQIQHCKWSSSRWPLEILLGVREDLRWFGKVRALSPSVEAAPLLLLLDADVLQAQRARDEADLAALLHQPPYPPVVVVFLQHREGSCLLQISSFCYPHSSTPHWILIPRVPWPFCPVPCWFNFKVDLMSRTHSFELRLPNNLPAANIKITPSASHQILLVRFNGLDKISPLSLPLFRVFVGMLLTGYDRLRKIHL